MDISSIKFYIVLNLFIKKLIINSVVKLKEMKIMNLFTSLWIIKKY